MRRIVLVLLALLLVAASFSLITAGHRGRNLTAQLERAQQETKRLEAEGNRLRIELSRASQPAAVEAAARNLGMRSVDAKNAAFLPAPPARERAP
jgi:cell division protein FtsL